MKHFVSLCALVLAGFLPAFASIHHTSTNPQNQFHFQPTGHRAAQAAAHKALRKQNHRMEKLQGPASKTMGPTAKSQSTSAKKVRRHALNPPTGKTGFLAATQIVAGGATYWPALEGDFNGDGKSDIVSEVANYDSNTSSYVYSISVVLGNGDGTFQPPVLTTITDTCPALLVADLNGDGKSDLIIGHSPNNCGNTNTNPTFDVWLSNGDGTFTPSANMNNTIPTTGLSGGTLADVNADGKLDAVLVDDNNPANVWTLLGNGDGTFQAPTSVALSGQAGYNTIVADLNGDGWLDIADNDYNTNQLTVFLATSATTWAPPVTYATADGNYYACNSTGFGMSVGDLTGHGVPDIVNANCSDSGNDITVYVNDGHGNYATGVYYNGAMSGGTNSGPADLDTEAVTIADVNGDAKGDIITSNNNSSDVTILLGNGDGTVTVPTVGYAYGGNPWFNGPIATPPIVADFNGDGFADIVVPDQEFNFVYLRGYGDGSFRSALDYYAPSNGYSWTYGIATGDFNKDGHPDFVIGNICTSCTTPMGVTVFLSNPDGSMQPGVNYGTTSHFGYVAVADFNLDGKLDIAATDDSTGIVQIFNGDGTGNFTAGATFNTDLASNSPNDVVVGDFNKDGSPDLAIANPGGCDISILLNDGAGNFPTPVPITLNFCVNRGFAVADLGNGNLDIVAPLYWATGIAVFLGNGDGTFQTEQDLPLPASWPTALTLADLNGDGKLDVAVVLGQGSGQDITVALGNGDGTFGAFSTPVPSSLQDYNLDTPNPVYIKAADVDGDGKLDLVYSNGEYGTVGVLFGKGDGTFFDPVEYPVGQYSWGLAVVDVNGDKAPDVVTASYDFAGVSVLLNNSGNASLGAYTVTSDAPGATIPAGQPATFTLTITPKNHYNGTITFACLSGLPDLTACTFSPTSVTLDGLTSVTTKLTITTTAPTTPSMRLHAAIDPRRNPPPRSIPMLLASLTGMGVFGLIAAGSFHKKRTLWGVLGVLALTLSFFFVGCGGSSNSHPTPSKTATTSTVTSSAATVVVGKPVTFTGTVTAASGTPTGSVAFLDGTTTLGTGTLGSGTATYQTSALAAGVHNITVSYAGDSNFNASTSSPFSETVQNPGTPAGSYTVTVTGTGTAGTNGVGTPNQSVNLNLTVQ